MQEGDYNSIADYDAAQSKLADTAKDGVISRYIVRKMIRMNKERGSNGALVVKQNIAHDIPKIMFILLPLFALFVQMLYGLYNNRKYLYSQHAIFALHYHSFVFLAFMILELLSLTGMSFKTLIVFNGMICLVTFVYLAIALHKVYNQKIWLSFVKALIITIFYVITLTLLMIIVFILAFIAL